MTPESKRLYEETMALLRPALERVASDAEFRERLENAPLRVMDELGIKLDDATRSELQGKRFSEFWAARRRSIESPVETRDLPPKGALRDEQLEAVSGGAGIARSGIQGGPIIPGAANLPPTIGVPGVPLTGALVNFAPPYVPVGPVVGGDNNT